MNRAGSGWFRRVNNAAVTALIFSGCVLGAAAPPAQASDWPQWRGPSRNGISKETQWTSRWPAGGPRRLWGKQVGQGFSSVAVSAGRLYTMGNMANQDVVSCLQATTGKTLWQYRYPAAAGDYPGPRATPTVHAGNVYTLSREGLALCLNAVTGKQVWRRDVGRDARAQAPGWGFASSPLIQGNLVLYNVGRAGVALDKKTGRIAWVSGPGTAGYSSPVPFTIVPQQRSAVAIFAGSGIVALNPATGSTLWQYPWNTSFDVNAADPIFSGDTVFISSNYGKGGALLRLSGNKPSLVWENRNMRNHFNSCVLVGGALFGNDENTLKCIDLRTGTERWRMRGMGKGGLIAAGGKLLVLTERGELVVANAAPDRFTEIARAKVLDGTCWTHPVLANGLLYCRSQEGSLVCLDLRSKVGQQQQQQQRVASRKTNATKLRRTL